MYTVRCLIFDSHYHNYYIASEGTDYSTVMTIATSDSSGGTDYSTSTVTYSLTAASFITTMTVLIKNPCQEGKGVLMRGIVHSSLCVASSYACVCYL